MGSILQFFLSVRCSKKHQAAYEGFRKIIWRISRVREKCDLKAGERHIITAGQCRKQNEETEQGREHFSA